MYCFGNMQGNCCRLNQRVALKVRLGFEPAAPVTFWEPRLKEIFAPEFATLIWVCLNPTVLLYGQAYTVGCVARLPEESWR